MGLLIGVLIEPLRRNYKHRQKGHRSHVSLFMVLICILIPFTVKAAKSYSCLRVNKFHQELVPSIGLKQSQNPELWNSWHPHGEVALAVIYSDRYIIGCMLTRTDGCAGGEYKELQITLLETFLGTVYQEQRTALPFVGWDITSQRESITGGSPSRVCLTPTAKSAPQALPSGS